MTQARKRSRSISANPSTSNPASALVTFERALAIWRGPALADFAFANFAQREIRRLEELRLETVEGRFEAMLQLGRHGAVVAELGFAMCAPVLVGWAEGSPGGSR